MRDLQADEFTGGTGEHRHGHLPEPVGQSSPRIARALPHPLPTIPSSIGPRRRSGLHVPTTTDLPKCPSHHKTNTCKGHRGRGSWSCEFRCGGVTHGASHPQIWTRCLQSIARFDLGLRQVRACISELECPQALHDPQTRSIESRASLRIRRLTYHHATAG